MNILGISGNPLDFSRTDCVVQAILNASGINSEFIKLCSLKGELSELEEKVRRAEALVIGCYSFFGSMDKFTKAFLEHICSWNCQKKGLIRGKLAVVINSGVGALHDMNQAKDMITIALRSENAEIMEQLDIEDNPACIECKFIETRQLNDFLNISDREIPVKPEVVCSAKDMSRIWEKVRNVGQEIARRLKRDFPSEYWL